MRGTSTQGAIPLPGTPYSLIICGRLRESAGVTFCGRLMTNTALRAWVCGRKGRGGAVLACAMAMGNSSTPACAKPEAGEWGDPESFRESGMNRLEVGVCGGGSWLGYCKSKSRRSPTNMVKVILI